MAEEENTEEENAEASEGEDGEGEESSAGSKKKKIMIIAVGAVLLVGIIVGVLFFLGVLGGGGEGHDEEEQHVESQEASGFYEMPEILVNLNTQNRRKNFMKVKVTIEIAGEAALTDMERLKPKIIDTFQVYLREVRPEDMKGSTGLYRLREELLRRVAIVVHPVEVRDVLFQDVVIQ